MEQMTWGSMWPAGPPIRAAWLTQAGRFTWSGRKFRTTAADLERCGSPFRAGSR